MEAASLPLTGHVAAPANVAPPAAGLRIALALTGGGYRAALLHAGVLMELDRLGIPISNVSSVSGGSIIGAYIAKGGDPAEFVKAVIDGRSRLKRELLSAFNLPRWILPFGNFSRRDVQAQIVRRVLLSSVPNSTEMRPALMAPNHRPGSHSRGIGSQTLTARFSRRNSHLMQKRFASLKAADGLRTTGHSVNISTLLLQSRAKTFQPLHAALNH
ncbi:patatin-like phospholipase family protein [Mesorhizobium sp.]|uniref:patatin-like phospholipase family protein n=1 Tax=Mesorhizobium sp. TaxID=1871066 RepID=UPI00120D02DD|nr:patatin-like phospholipase family protein [Mesorhizobium sp.]TIO33408.1 MAG: hypothetical protein E5X89_16525 [Mesorhizobium sp.]